MPSEADERITAADLPEPCAALLRTVVKRTRLWPSEKTDVAAELIDHVADALAAERAPEQIVADFGNPTAAAKLIRRSRKRQRHPIARSVAAATRGLGIAVLTVVVVYAGLAVRFFVAEPSITTNYIAMLSEDRPDPASLDVDGMLPHQHYNTARLLWYDFVEDQKQLLQATSDDARTDTENPLDVGPNHPEFAAVESKVRSLRPLLDQVQRSAAMPDHGTPFATDIITPNTADRSLPIAERLNRFAPMPEDPADQQPLYDVLLPHLGDMRRCSMLLGFDARLALDDNQPDAAIQRWFAMLDLAEQSQRDGYLISSLVALAIHSMTVEEITQGLAEHESRFTDAQLVDLAHRLAPTRSSALFIDLSMERLMLEDVLQRTFTDDGNGNGTITLDGLNTILKLSRAVPNSGSVADLAWNGSLEDTVVFATLPASPAFVADRRAQRQIMVEYYDRLQAATQRKPYERRDPRDHNELIDVAFKDLDGPLAHSRYIIPRVFMPATGKAFNSLHLSRTRLDATLLALAAESYRRDHNSYPNSIDQLVPRYLPAVPDDPFNPDMPLLYQLVTDRPMIYSVGENGADDGGKPTLDPDGEHVPHRLWARYGGGIPYEGDWILYPPAD